MIAQVGLKTGSKVMLLGKKYDPAQEEGYRQPLFFLLSTAMYLLHCFQCDQARRRDTGDATYINLLDLVSNVISASGRCWRQRRRGAQWR